MLFLAKISDNWLLYHNVKPTAIVKGLVERSKKQDIENQMSRKRLLFICAENIAILMNKSINHSSYCPNCEILLLLFWHYYITCNE